MVRRFGTMAAQDICRLSELPESFLYSNIISRLPLIDAVRSSILCSRWRYLWTKIPHLSFSADFFSHLFNRAAEGVINIEETMEHILLQHDAPLESFDFHISRRSRNGGISASVLEQIDIEQCIHYAAGKGVKKMLLEVDADFRGLKMDLPLTVFGCNALLYLEISRFIIPEIPRPTISENFSFLKTCCLRNTENLTDKSLQGLLELCPVLLKLVLFSCSELVHLKFQVANLNCLILVGCSYVKSLTADCPQLSKVKIGWSSSLAEVQINSHTSVELKVRDCYKLSQMQLNSCMFLKEVGSLEALSIEGHSTVESLRRLSLIRCSSGLRGLACPTLVGVFPDLEELKVSSSIMGTAMVRGEKTEVISDFIFPNLKNASMYISSHRSKEDIAVLGFVLRNSPSLKTLKLNLSYCFEDIDEQEFKNQLLGLKQASAEVEIEMLNEDDDEDEEDYYQEPEYNDRFDYTSGFRNDVEDYEQFGWDPREDGYSDREEEDDDYTSSNLLAWLALVEDDYDYENEYF